jgi:hypothetical protein
MAAAVYNCQSWNASNFITTKPPEGKKIDVYGSA